MRRFSVAADTVIQPIKTRLDDFRQQTRVQAGSLIISMFGDAILPRGGRVWLGSLIRLLEPLELNERLVRTSVFRLAKEEWLRTETVGRRADYVLTNSGRRRFEEASRHIYASHAPLWDRRWRLILAVGEFEPKERERLRQALFWQGFGVLGADCFVHPSADLTAAFDALVAEGLSAYLDRLMPLLAADSRSGLSANDADLVRRAWNLDALASAYSEFVATYLPALAELRRDRQAEVGEEDAFLLRTLLIHDYRRLLLRDPELPDVLLPVDWPGQKARLLCKELYRRLVPASERHLDHLLTLADGTNPPCDPSYADRFPQDDPLAAMAL
ncbi:phenylacetic acid degradation operon negative regulatory protein PaaX [Dechloromonas denitrificans]|jgi:phenylacetic acid degradation operon negative regulatory protein|uniref:phenylacetic acid degradation operon negative regulatory protein PaaX n=1 Tax=Dechloromonas denitrificans TaxID=281362 RepID=UPI001CFBA9A0|nr:phenylacetic acid degradation operon negative regulatory protein PaaX [Dechloromonas denitrificans]UCV08129.1 phenylacetic acid degradation operon negative regulatory protein PaaX [Dechloromonas denitrificans]